jgi:uncharacterized membrane protein YgcG
MWWFLYAFLVILRNLLLSCWCGGLTLLEYMVVFRFEVDVAEDGSVNGCPRKWEPAAAAASWSSGSGWGGWSSGGGGGGGFSGGGGSFGGGE